MFLAEPLIYGLLETVKSPEVVAVLRPGSWSNLYVSRALVSTRLPRESTRPNANSWYFNSWQRRSESRDAKLRVNDRRIAETRIARDGVFVSSVTRGHKVRVSRRTLSRRTDFPLFIRNCILVEDHLREHSQRYTEETMTTITTSGWRRWKGRRANAQTSTL